MLIGHNRKKSLKNRVVLVTGSDGFVGFEFCQMLRAKYPDLRLITAARNTRRQHLPSDKECIYRGDLRDYVFWRSLPDDITHIIHLAGRKPAPRISEKQLYRDNLVLIKNLVRRARNWSYLRQVVVASSVSVYRWNGSIMTERHKVSPIDGYARAKSDAEAELRRMSPKIRKCVLRISSVYGVGCDCATVIPQMMTQAKTKNTIQVYGAGDRVMDFIYVDDLVRMLTAAFQKELSGVYNAGSGKSVSMKQLADKISKCFDESGRCSVVMMSEKSEGGSGVRISTLKAQRDLLKKTISLNKGLKLMKNGMLSASN